MYLHLPKSLLSALSLVSVVHGLPGRPTATAQDVASKASSDSTTVTAASVAEVIKRNAAVVSADCDSRSCIFYDVSLTALTTIDANSALDFFSTVTPCRGLGCPTSVSLLTTGTGIGTGTGPEVTSASGTQGPFANGTGTTDGPPRQPTGGNVSSALPGTGLSPEANNTVLSTSTLTLLVTTTTVSGRPVGTGTGGTSGFPTPCTTDAVYSNQTYRGTGSFPSQTFRPSIIVSDDQTYTTQVATPADSYISTATYTFADSTVKIPVPASFTRSLPDISQPAAAAARTAPSSTSETPGDVQLTSSASSTGGSLCFTTTKTSASASASGTATARPDVSRICWGFSCVEGVCNDWISSTTVAAEATALASTAPYSNGTSPVPAQPVSSRGTSTGYLSASAETATPSDVSFTGNTTSYPWQEWTSSVVAASPVSTVSSGGAVATPYGSDDAAQSNSSSVPDNNSDDDNDNDRDASVLASSLKLIHKREKLKAKDTTFEATRDTRKEHEKEQLGRQEKKYDGLLEKKRAEGEKMDVDAREDTRSCCHGMALGCWLAGALRC